MVTGIMGWNSRLPPPESSPAVEQAIAGLCDCQVLAATPAMSTPPAELTKSGRCVLHWKSAESGEPLSDDPLLDTGRPSTFGTERS